MRSNLIEFRTSATTPVTRPIGGSFAIAASMVAGGYRKSEIDSFFTSAFAMHSQCRGYRR